MEPFFTVVMPTYNRPHLVHRAVRSVLSQSFADIELLIIDDASEDAPDLETVLSSDPRVQLYRNQHTLGAGGARNVALARARGRYVSFLDDDDEMLPEFLTSTYRAIVAGPGPVELLWCNVEYVNYCENSTTANPRRLPEATTSLANIYAEILSVGTGHGVTVRTSSARELGGFDEKYRVVEDTDFFLRLLQLGAHPRFIPEIMVRVHNHKCARLTSSTRNGLRHRECLDLLEQHRVLLDSYPVLQRQLRRTAESLGGGVRHHDGVKAGGGS